MYSKETGIEFNNPNICIKDRGTFVCVCPGCKKEMEVRPENWLKELKPKRK